MDDIPSSIPRRITLLIVGFFLRTLTEAEHAELDEWITASSGNQKVFEDCVELKYRPVIPHPDDYYDKDCDYDVDCD